MKRVIIVGSPRSKGRSAHLAEMLFEANIDERPEDELFLVPVSEIEVGPCIGCGACRKEMEVTFKNDDGEEVTELRHRCVFDDDMQTVYDLIDEADELTIVSPVYFSGAPAPMKCVLDRMQPYFWATQWGLTAEEARALPKRPASLHVIGEGGDPHGFMPLVSEVKSSLACAGFRLERVYDWVGKIDEAGEIVAEATEVELAAGGVMEPAREIEIADAPTPQTDSASARPRPKLDLSSSSRKTQSKGGSAQKDRNAGAGKRQAQKRSGGQSSQKGKSSARASKGKGKGARG